jgi:glutamate racemase
VTLHRLRTSPEAVRRLFKSSSVMKTKPILYFDSGVGGLPYLADARDLMPGERFIYLADRKHFPYGEKTQSRLRRLVLGTMQQALARFDPKVVVVACNTASVVALDALRSRFALPFVGVVPAVKLAADRLDAGRIGVLATRQTSAAGYTDVLISSFAPHCEVMRIPLANMVELVEYDFFTTSVEEKLRAIAVELDGFACSDFDTIVLGCTHFILIEEELRLVLGKHINLVDSRSGVSRQLMRVLQAEDMVSGSPEGKHCLYVTGHAPPEERYRLFAERYGLKLAGTL